MILEHAFVVAALFAACHAFSPWLFRRVEEIRGSVSSFSGGLAVSYVFLHLLPEISEGSEVLGPRIYFAVLVGLSLFYVLEVVAHRKRESGDTESTDANIHFGAFAVYSCLLVFTLGQTIPDSVGMRFVFALSMGLHLLSSDFGLQEHHGDRYVHRGRWILVGAVAVGAGMSLIRDPHPEATDLVTALLSGFVMFNVFRKELPDFEEARLRAFLLGMSTLLVAHILLADAG